MAIIRPFVPVVAGRLVLFFVLLFPAVLPAQEHHEMGIACGVANYYGTLQPSFAPSYGYKSMGGILYKYFMTPFIGIRTGLSYTNLTAADSLSTNASDKGRNLSFSTHLVELHGVLEINFTPIDVAYSHFGPYIFGGLAAFYYDPYALDPNGHKVYLRPLSTEGEGLAMYPDRRAYSLINMSFPFGGGLKFLFGRMVFTTEAGFRYTNTGYLDDVSKSYVDLNTLAANKGMLAKEMSYRGNTLPGWNGLYPSYGDPRGNNNANDWYWYGNITLTWFFHRTSKDDDMGKTDCPKIFR